jgi:hypothetical protein
VADDPTLKERCVRRLQGMKSLRTSYEEDAKEIARYSMPARSRFLSTNTNKGRQRNNKLNSSHGITAFRTLQGGMTSGLSSQSRPWFALSVYDDDIAEDPQVKAWLGTVEERVYAFLAHTNFYDAAEVGYAELGGFGTEACVMLEDDDQGSVCHPMTFGEYWISLNKYRRPGALYRLIPMTALQVVETFKEKAPTRARSAYDRSDYEEQFDIYQAIEQNDDYIAGRLGPVGKPWRSVYWDDTSGKDAILIGGYEEQPFWAPRWSTTSNDVWGQGPGHDALPDLKELQLQTKRKAEVTDNIVWPETVSSSKVKLRRQPKSVVSVASADNVGQLVSVPYEVPPQTLQAVREDLRDLKESINETTFATLFLAITNMPGMQPRTVEEIAARNEEKMQLLGPVIERVNNEKLKVALDRAIGIMQRKRMLPPAPEVLRNSPEIKIEFVSILTQMQRMIGLGQIERTVQFVGGLAGLYPQSRFKLDPNEIIDEYAKRAGAPPKIIRSTDEADQDAQAEAQQQQAAQAAEMAAKVGGPVKDVTDAAQVAANLPVAQQAAVPDLLG